MNREHIRGRGRRCLAALAILVSLPLSAEVKATGSGTLVVDGKAIALDHILFERYGSGVVSLLLSDRALPAPCMPLDAMAYVEKEPLAAVMFSVMNDGEISQSGNAIYHPELEPMDGYGAMSAGNIVLQPSGGATHGTLKHEVEVEGRAFAVEAEFDLPGSDAKPTIAPRTITGADSKPAKAFAELVDAVVALDSKAVMRSVTAEARAQMEPEPDAALLADFAAFMLPARITIVETSIDGDTAVVRARGETDACMGVETSEGTIDLVRDGRQWKVAKMSWDG